MKKSPACWSPTAARPPSASCAQAAAIDYPLMLKASWGGGGRGMRAIDNESELGAATAAGCGA